MSSKRIVINFTKEKETKNTIRYQEDPVDEQGNEHPKATVVGYIYLQRFAVAQMEDPGHITVTIENTDVGA